MGHAFQSGVKRVFEDHNLTLQSSFNLSERGYYRLAGVSITYDADYAVINDLGQTKIYRVDLTSGDILVLGGTEGRGPGENLTMWETTVDMDGTIFVTDYDKRAVSKWDIHNGYITEFNKLGKHVIPARIAVCQGKDIVYMLSAQYWKNGLLHKYDKSMNRQGSFFKIEKEEENSWLVTDGTLGCDGQGNLYYATMYQNFIRKFNPSGALVFEREVVDFEVNRDLVKREGRWITRNKHARVANGEMHVLNNFLFVSFSGTKGTVYGIVDIYDSNTSDYVSSIQFDRKFYSYDMVENTIVTLSEDENGDDILSVYAYDFFSVAGE